MYRCLLFNILIVGVYTFKLPTNGNSGFTLKLENMEPCADKPEGKIMMENIEINHYNRTALIFDGSITFKEESDNIKLVIDVTKCDSKQQTDSCQHFMSTTVDNICSELPKGNTSYDSFLKSMDHFQRKCPLKPGTYPVVHAPVDLSFFKMNPLLFGYWVCEVNILSDNKFVGCNTVMFSVVKKKGTMGQ